MIVLSLDCAGEGCAVCVWQNGRVLSVLQEKMARGQDSRLVPMIQEILKETRLTFENLDRIAVTKGPGSYTGLRIGLAAARSIGLAANVPIFGVDRFAIYRAQYAQEKRDLLIVLNSRRDELYTQVPPYEPCVMSVENIVCWCEKHEKGLILGDCADLLAPFSVLSSFLAPLRQDEIVTVAELAAQAAKDDPEFAPRPFYLRPPDVTVRCKEC